MIEVAGLFKAFGGQDLFRDANLRIVSGERVAVVGPNGAGKTTLFRMLAGDQAPDKGEVRRPKDLTIGYLHQDTDPMRGRSVMEEVLDGRPDLVHSSARLRTLEDEMIEATELERSKLISEYGDLQHRFEAGGGYAVEHEAKTILGGLAFGQQDFGRPTESFSGGWLMRIALAKLLLARPGLLLLDEPTNHLDLESVEWLEKFLASYGGTVIFTSHDREFINGFARKVVELRNKKLFEYTGNFDDFVEQRELHEAQLRQAAAQQARQVKSTERFIERFRYKNTKARQVQSRIKMLEKMDRVEVGGKTQRSMKLRFPPPPRIGRVAVDLSDLRFAYDETPVFDGIRLTIEGNWKVTLVGPNGAGKTTLLKLIAGVLTPQEGVRKLGPSVSIGYFAQHQIEALNPELTVLEELQQVLPAASHGRGRDLLGRFLFTGDDVFKKVSVLSGGERTRLAMAKLLASPHNLLCLDEPTNHLDMQSRDVVGEALEDFPGAIVLITHDRNLIREVSTRIVQVIAGEVTVFDGNYDYYLERRDGTEEPVQEAIPVSTASTVERRDRNGAQRSERVQKAKLRRMRASLGQIERQLEEATAEAQQSSDMLSHPETYASWDKQQVGDLVERYEKSTRRLQDLEKRWEELAAALEESDGE